MDKNQYEFSKMFFEDVEWVDRIPKRMIENNFQYLSDDEMDEFLDIYYKENKSLLNEMRAKKLKSIK